MIDSNRPSPGRTPSSRTFDLVMVALLALLVVGGHVLIWADDPTRNYVSGDQLFSIWALPLYAGLVPAAYLLFVWWSARRRGGDVPFGYRAALIGAAIFILALAAEFASRSVADRPAPGPEGVLAPSRIALFIGTALMVSGPLLALCRRLAAAGVPRRVASVDGAAFAVALGLLLSITTLLTGFIHPFVVLAGAPIEQPLVQTPTDLYRVPIDGSGSQRLTVTPTEWEVHPAIAFNGSLAYARGQLNDFRVSIDAADGTRIRVDPREIPQDSPVYSPDGARIAYWAPLNAAPAPEAGDKPAPVDLSGLAIWIYNQPDGTTKALHQVGGEGVEAWSPDGSTLCGWSIANGSFDIYTWDVTTGASHPVTNDASQEWGCSWAPDGSRLYFHSDATGNWELYSAAPDGTDVRQLTDDPGIDQLPHLSPDGTTLAWMSSRDGDLDIFLADADGANPRNLTRDPALEDGFYGFTWLSDGSGLIAASAGRSYAAPGLADTVPLGVGAITLNALIFVGLLLLGLRLVGPMVGMGTIAGLIGGLLAALVGQEPLLFVAGLAGGAVADFVLLRSGAADRRTAMIMAGTTAFVLVTVYFIALDATRGIGWGFDLVIGSIVLSSALAMAPAFIGGWSASPDQSAEADATISP
ncbi:MAG: hypothetical protein ABI744_00570 [Chloroflexota bacterium]